MARISIREIAYTALGVALLIICSWLSVPLTVPFTMQTFAVCLVAALFGLKIGMLAVAVYLLLGIAGVPVFAGFEGGLGYLLGATGGYLVGFLLTALVVGIAADKRGRGKKVLISAMVIGVLLCYALGTAWFVLVYTRTSGPVGVATALVWCVLPYVIPDIVKIVMAALLTNRLHPLLWKDYYT
ncbi:MAG: biotin transporter BioY [Oscillospiraceae bacterium]|nr:biotin transporter BioY [Oscillospiraceae bacterium]